MSPLEVLNASSFTIESVAQTFLSAGFEQSPVSVKAKLGRLESTALRQTGMSALRILVAPNTHARRQGILGFSA